MLPVECQVSPPVFNFGRAEMSQTSPPVYSNATLTVACTRREDGYDADVAFRLKALPGQPARQMRDRIGGAYLTFDMYVDPARTRYWGDGYNGTEVFEGFVQLSDRNRVGNLTFVVYGKVHGQQLQPHGPYLGAVLTQVEYEFSCHSEGRSRSRSFGR